MSRIVWLWVFTVVLVPAMAKVVYTYRDVERISDVDGYEVLVEFSYPELTGNSAQASKISAFINYYIHGFIDDEPSHPIFKDYNHLADYIVKRHKEKLRSDPDYKPLIPGLQVTDTFRIAMNRGIVTLNVWSVRYTGGASGPQWEHYRMFGPKGDVIKTKDLLIPDSIQLFSILLYRYFCDQYQGEFRDLYSLESILDPHEYALTEEGLLILYKGCCSAEGYLSIVIPMPIIYPLLKGNIKEMIRVEDDDATEADEIDALIDMLGVVLYGHDYELNYTNGKKPLRISDMEAIRELMAEQTNYDSALTAKYEQALAEIGNIRSTTASSLARDGETVNFVPYDDPPVIIGELKPVYPDFAKRARVQGTVVLNVEVYKDGSIGNITVQRSVTGLDDAAIDAVRKIRFQPGKCDNQPVDTTVIIPVKFILD